MTEIVPAAELDEQKNLRASSIMQKWSEINQIKLDELRRPDELLHRTSMEIRAGVLKVTNQEFGSKKWTIYRVDQNLKKLHDEATFYPKLVSIGPFHHNKSDHLKPMEDHKWRFLSRFLNSMKHYHHYSEIIISSSDDDDDDTIIIDPTENIQCLVAEMEKLEDEARDCYSETFDDLGSKEFVTMMVLDGCFIIELLILFERSKGRCRSYDDPIFTSRSVLPNLMHDLLLLENQLPFEVLEKILKHKVLGRQYKLTDLILNFFNTMLFRENKVLDVCRQVIMKIPDHHHLLAVFRSSFQTGKPDHPPVQPNPNVLFTRILFWRNLVSRNQNYGDESDDQCDCCFGDVRQDIYSLKGTRERTLTAVTIDHGTRERTLRTASVRGTQERTSTIVTDRWPIQNEVRLQDQPTDQLLDIELKHMSIHCVTELREAGVKFKKRSYHHDLLDIEFKRGKLYIPTLYIDDCTSSVFLNFIAYEQHNHSVKPNFTSYLMFLDSLVNSSKDVEHLRRKRIIDHGLGSYEDVATLFHKICKDVVQDFGDDNYLSQVFKEVNKYFGKRRNRWRATWKHEYFRNPWAFSSFLAAVVLLVLTFLQTFFSMYAYFHPPS